MQKVSKGNTLGAVHFRSIIHSALFGPAFLCQSNDAICKLDDDEGIVVSPGLILMDISAHLRIDRFDRGTAKHPPEKFDGVTAHVHRDTTSRTIHIPKMGSMR